MADTAVAMADMVAGLMEVAGTAVVIAEAVWQDIVLQGIWVGAQGLPAAALAEVSHIR